MKMLKNVNAITVEASEFVLSDDEIFFDPGFISTDNQTKYKFDAINKVGPVDETLYLQFEDYNLSNLCSVCELDGQEVFCD